MKKYFWLGIILAFFLVTRLYKISQIPGSVYWDEASIGYNAYAITTDLKDEWGEFLPLHFRAFGEFKLPVYIYSVAILTKLSGVNEFALRLPAVIFSLGTLVAVYFLAGPLAGFFLAVSPWLFVFSRTGYEATAGLFFFLLFIYFLINHRKQKINIILAAIFAIASFYSYNSFRILIPIFWIVWFFKERRKSPLVLIGLAIFLVSLIPIVKLYKLDQGAVRLSTVGVKEPTTFVKNYFSHFSYDFLFAEGDANNRSRVPGWGELYLIELPLFIIGIAALFKKKNPFGWVLITFLLIAPIPAALTRESPHALRAILLAPTFAMISALGVSRKFLLPVVAIYLIFFAVYYSDFLKNYNAKTAADWQYEYKQIFKTTKEGVVTDRYAQPYIFALYYLKYSPQEFRSTVVYNNVDKWGFSTVKSFGNFEFK